MSDRLNGRRYIVSTLSAKRCGHRFVILPLSSDSCSTPPSWMLLSPQHVFCLWQLWERHWCAERRPPPLSACLLAHGHYSSSVTCLTCPQRTSPQPFTRCAGNTVRIVVAHHGQSQELYSSHKAIGDIVHLSVFGQSTIVIDSYDAAIELLEQRSSQTSDRPRLVMAELSVPLLATVLIDAAA